MPSVSLLFPWVNPSGHAPAPALGQGLMQSFPSAGDRHHLAELLSFLPGGAFLPCLLLWFGTIWGCGSSDCSVLHNRGGRRDKDASLHKSYHMHLISLSLLPMYLLTAPAWQL